MSYAIVTAARNESGNLRRLAASLAEQTVRPQRWLIVENGSTDRTLTVASELSNEHPWVGVLALDTGESSGRGAPIVHALHAGIAALEPLPEVIVNVDADVSFQANFFERLLAEFARDPDLGIASGSAFEYSGGLWRQRFTTRNSVWGATRAWRCACLRDVLPFEERVGWDGVDECKANARGWRTRTIADLPFLHHRPEGARDGSGSKHWLSQGELAHFLDYRPSYLLLRTLYQALRDPTALAMFCGYARCLVQRQPKCDDAGALRYIHDQQRWRCLGQRLREASGVPRRG